MPRSLYIEYPFSGPAIGAVRLFRGVVLAAAASISVCPPVAAQDADKPAFAVVNGLAMGDFLNIRATPSPIGSVEARLPNGVGLKNFGCAQYNGYDWCKVTTLTAPQVSGWTPKRYLRAASEAEQEALNETAAPSIGAPSPGSGSEPGWADRMAKSETAPADPPSDLDSRMGGPGEAGPGDTDEEKLRDALVARYGPLYRAALGRPADGDAGSIVPGADDAAAEADPPSGDGADAGGIPHPTPRPTGPGETVASVGTTEKAGGEIPCAGAFGQPMSMCHAAVTRLEPGDADVLVSLPDGASRTIRFRGGKPDGSDSSQPLQATREGSLNLIRIGKAERFEILDALALGK
jgi:uncharacterized protein YraI